MDRPPVVGPPPAEVTSIELDGRAVIVNATTSRVASLNETATAVWRLATGEHTLDEMVTMIAGEYGVDPQTINAEILATVDHLLAEGLLAKPVE